MIEKQSDHDAHACGQCAFIGHPDFISTTRAQRDMAFMTFWKRVADFFCLYDPERSIIPVGRYTLPGWNGHNMFWLFQCPGCRLMSVDYLHGHHLYLKCGGCEAPLHVEGERFYTEAGVPKRPTLRQKLAHIDELKRQFRR